MKEVWRWVVCVV